MAKFNVHLYAVVRLKVSNVEAESMEEAIEKADASVNVHELVDRAINGDADRECSLAHIEYAEEISSAMVDVVGDADFSKTRDFHYSNSGWKPGVHPRVLVTVSGGVADTVEDGGVEVAIFDHDNYKEDPECTAKVPALFAGMATDVPFETM